MIYSPLGNTGLQVSKIGFGNMVNFKEEDEKENIEIIKTCFEAGINFFDTAENYEQGLCESQLGRSLKALNIPREKLVISTKFINCTFAGGNPVNRALIINRKHIIDGLNASLERLQLDYVDVAFAHVWDSETPLEEICRGFNQVIEDGKALYWATSNWNAARVQQAFNICEKYDLIPPIAEQCVYNQLSRTLIEKEFAPTFQKGYGSTIYSPLQGGLLTGKYNDGNIPDNSRANAGLLQFPKELVRDIIFNPYLNDKNMMQKLNQLGDLAKELGVTQAQLSLAWAVVNKDVSTAIVGAKSVKQLKETLGCLDLVKKWNAQIEEKVESILGNAPVQELDFRALKPQKSRRIFQ